MDVSFAETPQALEGEEEDDRGLKYGYVDLLREASVLRRRDGSEHGHYL
jgi:hypothetical protein